MTNHLGARRAAALGLALLLGLGPAPAALGADAAGPSQTSLIPASAANAGLSPAGAANAGLTPAGSRGMPLTYFAQPRPADATALATAGEAAPTLGVLADDGTHAVAVIGELGTARHIAVLVPGMGRNRGNLGLTAPGHGTQRAIDTGDMHRGIGLWRQLARHAGADSVAVVLFLGYTPPQDDHLLDVLGTERAAEGAPALQAATARLRAAAPSAHLTWVCHSYGSLVCADASGSLRAGDDVVFIGSPGTGLDRADQLAPARVWAALGTRDPIALVGIARDLRIAPFGPLPTDAEFGARTFSAGAAGHSGYLEAGSRSAAAIAEIVTGSTAQEA